MQSNFFDGTTPVTISDSDGTRGADVTHFIVLRIQMIYEEFTEFISDNFGIRLMKVHFSSD